MGQEVTNMFQFLIGILGSECGVEHEAELPQFQFLIGILGSLPSTIVFSSSMIVSIPYRYSRIAIFIINLFILFTGFNSL